MLIGEEQRRDSGKGEVNLREVISRDMKYQNADSEEQPSGHQLVTLSPLAIAEFSYPDSFPAPHCKEVEL